MNRFLSRSLLLAILIGAVLVSCNKEVTFTVEGNVKSAEGETLYLEHRSLGGIVLLDSAALDGEGAFKFKQQSPQNPEFYQLRLDNRAVVFTVDSTETVRVNADASDFYHTFTIEDSYTNSQLKLVDKLTADASQKIDRLGKQHDAKEIDDMEYLSLIDSLLLDYKSDISNLIIGNPSSAAAYYAAFQKIDDYLIFDPYNKQDYAMFAAVATSWNMYYPDAERTKHLYDFTMNALQVRRNEEQQAQLFENIPVETESGLPDIVLSNIKGENVALSDLKGKVVLLDFVVYNAEFSPAHNIQLNTIYNRLSSRGLEIYQISFDSDEHFWKVSAANLPWITVRHPHSVNATLLSTYNVREIPTAFIINREGDIVSRVENYSQLLDELSKVL